MTYVVSFDDFEVTPRFDDVPWNQLEISESADGVSGWAVIDTIDIDPVTSDPSDPEPISFTTEHATLAAGYYRIQFLAGDAGDAGTETTDVIFNSPPVELMASLDDIQAHLDGIVVRANYNNTRLLQISVARIIRGYLARTIDPATMTTWTSPAATPETIREIAARLIAAYVFINAISKTSLEITDKSFAQFKYNEAMAMLEQITAGTLVIPGVVETTDDLMTVDDFWPVDDTDRAFTMGMNL